jgi:ABC-type transport system involved in multi-copper enzyme maturation permease subunit
MLKIRQFITLAKMTAVESIRQPICLLLAISGILLTGITPLVVIYKFGEDGKLARDSGLAFHLIFGLIIAAYSASTSLARELRTGTASAILSKPVSRNTLFLAKFAGIASIIILFSVAAIAATMLSERIDEKFIFTNEMSGYFTDWHTGIILLAAPFIAMLLAAIINYFTRRPFESSAFILLIVSILAAFVISGFFNRVGQLAPLDYQVDWRLLPAGLLITAALIVITAIATAISTRFNTVITIISCITILMIGLISDYVLGRYAMNSFLIAGLYKFIPNWQNFWVSDALTGGGHIPWIYVCSAFGYAALYTSGILCLGILSFRKMEVT